MKVLNSLYTSIPPSLEVPKTLAPTLKPIYLTWLFFTQSISMMAGKLASSIGPAHEPGLSPPNPMFRMR